MEALQILAGFAFLIVIIVLLVTVLTIEGIIQMFVGIICMVLGGVLYNIFPNSTESGYLMLGGLAICSIGFANLTPKRGRRRRNFY